MTKFKLLSALSIILWVASSGVAAISVHRGQPVDTDQGTETVWTVSGGGEPIRRLNVISPVDVHVEYVAQDGADVLAKVILLGGSGDVSGIGDVYTAHKSDGVELVISANHKSSSGGKWVARVQLVTPNTLVSIASYSSGSIVVKDSVIANGKDVLLSTVSSGDLFVETADALTFGILSINNAGSGDVQVQASSITVTNDVKLVTYSSGDVAIITDELEAEAMSIDVVGSGELSIDARRFDVKTLSTEVTGSGEATFTSDDGHCNDHTVQLLGSGDVIAGAIACDNARVLSAGSGDVVVRASNQLTSTVYSSGTVKYEGSRPAIVKIDNIPYGRHHYVDPVPPHYKRRSYRPRHVPRYEPHEVEVYGDKHHRHVVVYDDSDDIDISSDDFLSLAVEEPDSPEANVAAWAISVGLAVFAAALLAIAAKTLRQRWLRSEYAPLRSGLAATESAA